MQTTNTLAEALETTPRTLRKFLRSDASGIAPVGKGSRYSLPTAKREMNALAKKFNAWQAEAEAKKAEVEVEAPEADAPTED